MVEGDSDTVVNHCGAGVVRTGLVLVTQSSGVQQDTADSLLSGRLRHTGIIRLPSTVAR